MARPMPQEPMKLSDEEYNKRFVQLAREWITSTKVLQLREPARSGIRLYVL